jgi:RNA polymerase sigma-70 factor (sigma-E family)
VVVDRDQASFCPPSLEVAFERFAARASSTLLRTAFLLTGDRGHAEDLLQATLWRVFRRWDGVRDSPDAYAYQVLVNLSRDRQRSLRRRAPEIREADTPQAFVVDEVEQFLERDAMTGAVRCLPRRQREVIALRCFLDLSVAETAAALGTREGTVKAYTARALARMRELVSNDCFARERASVEVRNAD